MNKMKKIIFTPALILFCSLLAISAQAQQGSVTTGIIAYSGAAYERAISDLTNALKNPTISKEDQCKAHFYRGMAKLKLLRQDPDTKVLGATPFLSADADFKSCLAQDPSRWGEQFEQVKLSLFDGLYNTGLEAYNKAKTLSSESSNIWYSRAIDHLRAAIAYQQNFHINRDLGKAYEALARIYESSGNTRAVANYRASVNYLESALNYDNDCMECAETLLNVSAQLNDESRIKKYTQLLNSLSGGSR